MKKGNFGLEKTIQTVFRNTPKRSYIKSSHSKNELFESNDDNNEERISIEDSEDSENDSDGLDEESEPDSDDLMESTENSEMGSPIKPTLQNKHRDEIPSEGKKRASCLH